MLTRSSYLERSSRGKGFVCFMKDNLMIGESNGDGDGDGVQVPGS